MTRYLITGAHGMLGRDLQAALAAAPGTRHITAVGRAELDITDPAACRTTVTGHDVVLNAAAYTAVDAAETDEPAAHLVNAIGAENLAAASRAAGAVLVQYSTDYVFDGAQNEPYAEDAPLAPVSAYGRTKAEGERRARATHPDGTIVLRTAWLYGEHGPSFVRTMVRLYREHGHLTVVNDQRGQPTWTRDLAEQTVRTLDAGVRNATLHGTNSGATTWHGFAQAIVENLGGDPHDVAPVPSAQFPRPAPRPANSVLGHDGWAALGLRPLRAWRHALDSAMANAGLAA
ncbi:MAG: dTDP-4-dehydrorhamnose reductase [Actinobacteria bacterium]|nr:dTDP-4-dehydrorhamnose reductase [Actinomycetota bacterium]MBU1609335.1 dTDP-4-dehydrorhamnose reductase [Actinomycetota bacterium]MBU2314967.1 dTDP-4-dehydrorhamnose reductase [Actinomycetota bacterium]MBU2385067.1 dTDP-4-dehydrorhamnose reductase [Actinomycetota bacterium]